MTATQAADLKTTVEGMASNTVTAILSAGLVAVVCVFVVLYFRTRAENRREDPFPRPGEDQPILAGVMLVLFGIVLWTIAASVGQ